MVKRRLAGSLLAISGALLVPFADRGRCGGVGCNTTGGPAPLAGVMDTPSIGGAFGWFSCLLAPGMGVVTVFGPPSVVPVDLAVTGLPIPFFVCFLYPLPASVFMAGVAGPAGCLVTMFAVPADPALVGTVFSLQDFQIIPGFPIDVLASNGVTLTIS